MAFQDFDHITERRRIERQRKFRKRVTIAAITAFVLVILIAAGIFAVVSLNNDDNSNSSSGKTVKEVNRSQKLIQTICSGTNYKNSCNDTLSTAAKKNPSLDEPQEFLKVAVAAISDEVAKGMNKASKFNLNSEEDKAAFNVCKKFLDDAKKELKASISYIEAHNLITKFVENAHELNNWLSAVISYQQTCIDGFPEAVLKSDMERALTPVREFASNSLAIIQQFSTYVSAMSTGNNNEGGEGSARRLLQSGAPSLDKDGFPSWLSHEDKRMLQEQHNDQNDRPKPNATVAKDGSGNFQTIQAALDAMPKNHNGRYVIYIKEGVYDEVVTVKENMWNVTLYGDGSQKTVITGKKNCKENLLLVDTASFVAEGQGLLCKSMGFRNTAGPEKDQAVAARVQSDRAVFVNCRFEGYQDTLWVQAHRQFYRSCVISGTVDFIFGDAAAIFQNCLILARKGLAGKPLVIVAQGRTDSKETTATVLQNCRIEPEEDLAQSKKDFNCYLGRPWKPFSRVIIMESTIADFIHPDGWTPYRGDSGLNSSYYAEYNNKGDGAKTNARVKWPGVKKINKKEAEKFTVGVLFSGEWIKRANAPVHFGLMNN